MAEQANRLAFADFYNGKARNETASVNAGRPIYDDVEMIRIRWAGNTKNEFHAPASDRSDRPVVDPATNDKYWPTWKEHPDFAAAYEAFKKGQAMAASGTPLEEWPSLTEAKRAELKAINIHTVDQLANLDANGMKRLGIEGPELKAKAQAYLDRAAGAAVDERHARERAEMQRQIDELRAMVAGGGEAAPKAKVVRVKEADNETDLSASPFNAMDDESIRLWCKEADPSGEQPHSRLGHAKLVAFADALNARIKAAREQVAA